MNAWWWGFVPKEDPHRRRMRDPVLPAFAGFIALLAGGLAVTSFLDHELLTGTVWWLAAVAQAALARFTYIRHRDGREEWDPSSRD